MILFTFLFTFFSKSFLFIFFSGDNKLMVRRFFLRSPFFQVYFVQCYDCQKPVIYLDTGRDGDKDF